MAMEILDPREATGSLLKFLWPPTGANDGAAPAIFLKTADAESLPNDRRPNSAPGNYLAARFSFPTFQSADASGRVM